MILRLLRTALLIVGAATAAYVGRRVIDERRHARRLELPVTSWPPVPLDPPAPLAIAPPDEAVALSPAPDTVAPAAPDDPGPPPDPEAPWADPVGDGACPPGYPVKAKLRSRLFHLPGMAAYDRTRADRCYASAALAEADGFTRARR